MNEFKREWRFIVAKVKHLTPEQCQQIVDLIGAFDHPPMECVVVESDWPNYEDTWEAIEQVSNGEYQSPYDRIEQLERERDELAAHVETLRGGLNDAIEALVSETMESGVVEENEIHDLRTLEMSIPQTSLAEVKAKAAKEGIIAAALSLNAVKPERHHSYADGHEYGYYVAYQLVFAFAEKHAQQIRNGKDGE
jgi:hypothetical protein